MPPEPLPPHPSVTAVVLTYDGERYVDRVLTALEAQDYPAPLELLVIDSGSTDRTLAIVAEHPRVLLHEIPNAEFGHGRTRDLAARLASGEIVAYLTHDAIPSHPGWLRALVAPMVDDPRIVAVMGKQIPRRTCDPMQKYAMERLFHWLGPDFGHTVFWDDGSLDDPAMFQAAAYYSDANSAARRDVLTGPVPYRDVAYAEDQLFGRDVLRAGMRKAYAPGGSVIHSNDLDVRGTYRRAVDDVVGLRRLGTAVPELGLGRALVRASLDSARHGLRVLRDRDYPRGQRLRWFFGGPPYEFAQWLGHRRGTRLEIEAESASIRETR